jgi:pimeloyl-ACP methyl ester carboxylesterase
VPPPAEPLSHSERALEDPKGWVLHLSHREPERLVVFVHGFGGGAVEAWGQFAGSGREREWWRTTDLLFVGYDSRRDSITGVADRLRYELPRFFPDPEDELLECAGARVRDAAEAPYRELLLVGHSLGGVVVRRALCDEGRSWIKQRHTDAATPKPALLEGCARLFSPASAGFRPAGWLGLLRATRGGWGIVEMQLRRSSAFTDLQPESEFLKETRRRTELLCEVHGGEVAALQARIAWAQPDNVVLAEYYDSDASSDSVDGTTHRSVCKPHHRYELPWNFVETGRIR